jgi:hypothetical protein
MTDDSAKPIKTADSDRPKPIGIDPAAYDGDIVSRLRHWRGLHLAHNGELFEAAADEIERLRTIMYRVVDEDCTVAIQGGAILADDEVVCRVARAAHEMAGTATACTASLGLTDAEREAIKAAAIAAEHYDEDMDGIDSGVGRTLRALLERLR